MLWGMSGTDECEGSCLILGGTGFLGGVVGRRLGAEVRVSSAGFRQGPSGGVRVDLREPREVQALMEEARPRAVIHVAAYRDPDFCEQHPLESERLNVGSVRALCAYLPPSVPLLFASSDYVFDGASPPYHEESPVCPVNEYGRQKARAEEMVLSRVGGVVLRFPVLVGRGPAPDDTGFVGQMAEAVRSGRPQPVDDVLVRYPTWTEDVAETLAFLLRSGVSGVFHACGPDGGTRYQLSRTVAEAIGGSTAHLTPSTSVLPRPAQRPVNSRLLPTRLLSMGFHRFTPFRDVVQRVLADPPP